MRHPQLSKRTITKLADAADRHWICIVVDSGYHNGAHCRPDNPHGAEWGCGWYWRATVVARPPADRVPPAPTPGPGG